jgi:exosortase A
MSLAQTAASRAPWLAYRGIVPALLLALAAFGVLFRTEIAAATHVWYESTAYSHCYFVLPIAAWLAWDRRAAGRGLTPQPTAWPALAVLPLALAWFAAERMGLMEGRQLAALGMAQALLVALLGWRLAGAFAAPLAYLVFLVPFGSFITPDLQAITAWFVNVGLEASDIPHVVDAFTIEIPEGNFYVAEACAGLRFLIAAVAFGALYGCVTYRSPWKRAAFLAASIVTPVVANGIRALGIVIAGHIIGNTEAATADHLIYGWGFFSAVILLLTLAGLPFREDTSAVPPKLPAYPRADSGSLRALAVAGAATLLAAATPVAATLLDREATPPRIGLPGFVASPACATLGSGDGVVRRFRCGDIELTATMTVLPSRATPAALRAARSAVTGEQDAADALTSQLSVDGVEPRDWRVVELHDPDRMTATAAWIDGAPDSGGLAGRLRMAWQSVAGGARPPVLVAAAVHPHTLARAEDREVARRVLRDFLSAQWALLAAIPRAVSAE